MRIREGMRMCWKCVEEGIRGRPMPLLPLSVKCMWIESYFIGTAVIIASRRVSWSAMLMMTGEWVNVLKEGSMREEKSCIRNGRAIG